MHATVPRRCRGLVQRETPASGEAESGLRLAEKRLTPNSSGGPRELSPFQRFPRPSDPDQRSLAEEYDPRRLGRCVAVVCVRAGRNCVRRFVRLGLARLVDRRRRGLLVCKPKRPQAAMAGVQCALAAARLRRDVPFAAMCLSPRRRAASVLPWQVRLPSRCAVHSRCSLPRSGPPCTTRPMGSSAWSSLMSPFPSRKRSSRTR